MTAARGDLRSRTDQLGSLTRGSAQERRRAAVTVCALALQHAQPGAEDLIARRLLAALGLDTKDPQ